MVCEDIKWVKVKKLVHNVDSGKTEQLKFLWLNSINEYNHTMGDVDRVDQLCDSYQLNHWIQNWKWWWSIMFWFLGVVLTNAYIMKRSIDLAADVKEKHLIYQHKFQMQVMLH